MGSAKKNELEITGGGCFLPSGDRKLVITYIQVDLSSTSHNEILTKAFSRTYRRLVDVSVFQDMRKLRSEDRIGACFWKLSECGRLFSRMQTHGHPTFRLPHDDKVLFRKPCGDLDSSLHFILLLTPASKK